MITKSHILTPQLWRALKKAPRQESTPDALLFLTQGIFHDAAPEGFVTLRIIKELSDLEADASVYIEGAEEAITTAISVLDARLYATPQDIIEQNEGIYSLIFKLISYGEGEAVSNIYLWELPPITAPEAIESDIALSLPKGSSFYATATEEDIVMDRTFRVSEDHQVSVNIRTVEGRSYSTTVSQVEAVRCAQPGDYYLESGSDELSVVYGVTTDARDLTKPIIKRFVIPSA